MPKKKEINYLGKRYYYDDQDGVFGLFMSSYFIQRQRRKYLKKRAKYYGRRLPYIWRFSDDLKWDLNFLFMPQTERWYSSLFPAGSVSGDISPVYYRIPEEGVREIYSLFPDLKIVILVRNPIDRAWSHTKMRVKNNRGVLVEEAPKEIIFNSLKHEVEICSSYVDLISRWKKYFQGQNVFVGFFDGLKESPLDFFREICDFLGVESCQLPDRLLRNVPQKRNEGVVSGMPKDIGVFLASCYETCIEEMCNEYRDSYPQEWLNRCHRLLRCAS